MSIFHKFYHVPIIEKTFKTTVYQLKQALDDCKTVLDLGCGADSPIKYCKNITHSVGVEIYEPLYEEAKKLNIHDEYIIDDINKLNYDENSFDAVVAIEILEHLSKEDGLKMIANAKKWAKKKVVITTPNGYLKQHVVFGNKYQRHLSGWTIEEFEDLGFKVRGLSGIKSIRSVDEVEEDVSQLVFKYPGANFWYLVAIITQLYTYRFPKNAFELFCVFEKE